MIVKNAANKPAFSVLVVDDEPDVREIFRLVLGRKGYQVTLAESGEAAVQRAGESRFDLAFIDIAMPGIDGVETFRQLREIIPDLPAVMITAFVDGALSLDQRQDRVTDALNLGARGCLRKPFGMETILKTVEYFGNGS